MPSVRQLRQARDEGWRRGAPASIFIGHGDLLALELVRPPLRVPVTGSGHLRPLSRLRTGHDSGQEYHPSGTPPVVLLARRRR